ncbi:BON domain-containing protein [Ramlibacter albus]|uniref:BON domain-containing protein n=1 Tax=Ramlibacter albus TaxID=2079448 RepID=A0A923S3S6_9BURK|nr:BON domain-containing protein [Ramlibacter albus]MBC5766731.1 BON domain-containing protein [Ramlibacter albus]
MSSNLIAAAFAFLSILPAFAQQPRTNAFNDPFGQATSGFPACPVPTGPLLTDDEARREAHWRAERGTSCYRSGRCRLPNAYRYDEEIFPRALQYIRADGRFDDTSIWVTVQRRWVTVQGCVRSAEQGAALEAAVRQIDDVEAVIGQWMVGTSSKPPYESR